MGRSLLFIWLKEVFLELLPSGTELSKCIDSARVFHDSSGPFSLPGRFLWCSVSFPIFGWNSHTWNSLMQFGQQLDHQKWICHRCSWRRELERILWVSKCLNNKLFDAKTTLLSLSSSQLTVHIPLYHCRNFGMVGHALRSFFISAYKASFPTGKWDIAALLRINSKRCAWSLLHQISPFAYNWD